MDKIDEIIVEEFKNKSFVSEAHDPKGYFFKFKYDSKYNKGKGETNCIKCDHLFHFKNDSINKLIVIEKELSKRPVESISKYLLLFDNGEILSEEHPFLINPFNEIPLDSSQIKYLSNEQVIFYKDYFSNIASEINFYFIFSGYAIEKAVNRFRTLQAIYLGKILVEKISNRYNIKASINYRLLESGSPRVTLLNESDKSLLREDIGKLIPI